VPALRARVFDKLLRLGLGFFQRNASGSIINRVTTDVQSLRSFIDGVLLQGALLSFTLAVYVAYMVHVHAGCRRLPGADAADLAGDRLVLALGASRLREEPRAVRRDGAGDVRGGEGDSRHQDFGAEAQELERFRRRNRAVRDQQEQIFRRVSRFAPTVSFITMLDIAILLGYGGALVARDALTLGQLVVFAGLPAAVLDADHRDGEHREHAGAERDRRAPRVRGAGRARRGRVAGPTRAARACRGAVRFEEVSFGH
jgi:ATP-binding cassette subfamily B protein